MGVLAPPVGVVAEVPPLGPRALKLSPNSQTDNLEPWALLFLSAEGEEVELKLLLLLLLAEDLLLFRGKGSQEKSVTGENDETLGGSGVEDLAYKDLGGIRRRSSEESRDLVRRVPWLLLGLFRASVVSPVKELLSSQWNTSYMELDIRRSVNSDTD